MAEESKNILILMFLTVLSKGLGFIREVALAAQFGTTMYTDAYLIATSIPVIIFSSFGRALSTALIPLYIHILQKDRKEAITLLLTQPQVMIHILQKDGKEEALKFINCIFNIVGVLVLFLICLGFFHTRTVVSIFAIGFDKQALELTIKFTRILLPSMLFIGFTNILTGYMQANKKFRIPGMVSVPYNGIVIVSIFLAGIWNQEILLYGTLLGLASQAAFQIYFACRAGYSYRFHFSIHNSNIRKLFLLSLPIFFGLAAGELNVLIDKTLASTLCTGSISALNFANKLNGFVLETFAASIIAVVYPLFSELAVRSDGEMLEKAVHKAINGLMLMMIPVSTFMICFHQPIVKFLFQRGAFDERAAQMTSSALLFYSIGMMGLGIRELLSKVFYALEDTKTPMINGVIMVVLNIVLDILLLPSITYKGIALATSIASWAGLILLFYHLRKKISYPFGKQHCKVMLKGLLAALMMGIGVWSLYVCMQPLSGSGILFEGIKLTTVFIAGSGIYLIAIYLLGVEEIHLFLNMVKTKCAFICNFAEKIRK